MQNSSIAFVGRRLAVGAVWIALVAFRPARADVDEAKRLLSAKGLTPLGPVWIVADEVVLRRELQGLEALDRRLRDAMTAAEHQLRQNEQIRQWLAAVEKLPDDKKKRSSSAPSGSSASVAKLAESGGLKSSMPDVTGLGDGTPLQTAMVEWVTARSAGALAVLAIGRLSSGLPQQYAALTADSEVRAALAELGESARLGPLKNYRGRQDRVEALSQRVLTDRVPIYLESGREWVGILLNDRLATTAAIAQGDAPTVLSASLAESLGLAARADPPGRLKVAGRDVQASRARIASLRVGSLLVKDVEIFVLLPEFEDVGNQLGESTLAGARLALRAVRMEAVVEPAASR